MAIIMGLVFENKMFQIISAVIVVITVLLPIVLYPLELIWFGIAKVLGTITSTLVLGLIFFVVVTPVALIRKLSGSDRLMLGRHWKRKLSAYIRRDHNYAPGDLINPY